MHPITQAAGGGAVFLAVFALGASGAKVAEEMTASTVPALDPTPAPALTIDIGARCAEDDPCWTWSKMGNRRRGVLDLSTGRYVLVGPCAFRNLWMRGDADLSKPSQRMRGDWWAIHHGCRASTAATSWRPDGPAMHPSGVVEG